MGATKAFSVALPFTPFGRRSTTLRVSSYHGAATFLQLIGQRLCVLDHLLLVGLNDGCSASPNATALAAMTCISGPPWMPGKMAEFTFRDGFIIGQIMPPRAAQRLVRGGRRHMHMRERVGIFACRDQTGKVRNVRQQPRTNAVGDFAERKVEVAGWPDPPLRIIAGLALAKRHFVIVDTVCVLGTPYCTASNHLPDWFAFGVVGQVTTGIQRHAQNGVTGFDQPEIHLGSLYYRSLLHVGIFNAKRSLARRWPGSRPRRIGNRHSSGGPIAFGILVGHDRALCVKHSFGHDVF